MPVFKAFFAILRRNLPYMSIFFIVTFSVAAMVSGMAGTDVTSAGFSASKPRIAVLNADGGALSEGLVSYLGNNAVLVALKDDGTALQDALFYRDVSYIVRIPSGFSQAFLAGGSTTLSRTSVPDSTDGVQMDFLVNRYLQTAALYVKAQPSLSGADVAARVKSALAVSAPVKMPDAVPQKNHTRVFYFFNYLAYTLLAVLITGLVGAMMAFRRDDLRMRNACAPVKSYTFALQMVLGSLLFTLIIWALLVGSAYLLYGAGSMGAAAPWLLLNTLAFSICALCIAFIAGLFIKSSAVMSAFANVAAMGLSFLSGVFVPQQYLSAGLLRAASFTPVYWFVHANNVLSGLSSFTSQNLQPVYAALGVEAVFAAALLAVGIVLSRYRRLHGG